MSEEINYYLCKHFAFRPGVSTDGCKYKLNFGKWCMKKSCPFSEDVRRGVYIPELKKISEIFKGKEQLLELPEIKEVLENLRINLQLLSQRSYAQQRIIEQIQDCVFNSEVCVIKGYSCKKAIEKIVDILI